MTPSAKQEPRKNDKDCPKSIKSKPTKTKAAITAQTADRFLSVGGAWGPFMVVPRMLYVVSGHYHQPFSMPSPQLPRHCEGSYRCACARPNRAVRARSQSSSAACNGDYKAFA